jgi:two-component system, LuxR family, sensor kinase FixL
MPGDKRRRWLPLESLSSVAAVIVALSLFLAAVFFLNLNLARLKESFGWVQHTDDVLLQLAAIEATLIEAESAERGYILTGDARYREPYDRAEAGLDGQLGKLAQLVVDNPGQHARVDELRPVIDARMAQFKRVIDIGPSRFPEALAVIQEVRKQALTPAARERLEQLRQTEIGLLGERQQRVTEATILSSAIAAGAGVLGLASAGFGLFLFLRQRSGYRIRELQTELLHVSRLNTMGQTASMIAHEVKQPLAATATYLQGLRRMIETAGMAQSGRVNEALQKALAQVNRAADIVGRLRRFVERRDAQRQAERIDGVIDEAIALMAVDTAQVALRRRIEPNLPAVVIDRVEVQQVLINLMRNAVEAMSQSPRRELTLSAEAADRMVRIGVGDTGPGLPPLVADRLFQPFVSTKEDGMGVGLSICHTLVEGQGGRIWVTANPEGGTTFHFTLPAAEAGAERAA